MMSGAAEGLRRFFIPDLAAFGDASLWIDAVGQVFYSLSIMMAIMFAYGSYLDESSNLAEDCFIIAFSDAAISVLSGIVMFSTMGGVGMLDSMSSSGIATAVLKDRKILADNGLVAVIVSIDSRSNSILCRPNIVSRGFVFIKEGQTLLKEGEVLVFESLRKKMAQKTTFAELKNTIKDTLEPFLYSKTNRTPIVIPLILNYIDPNLEKK